MKKILAIITSVILILTFTTVAAAKRAPKPTVVIKGQVIYVADGDTFKLRNLTDSSVKIIRIADVDCPEKKQPYGLDARQFTTLAINTKIVEVTIKSKDLYGRIVGWVKIPDQQDNLEAQLVRVGLAWVWTTKRLDLKALENEARITKRGLWADPSPIAPWVFRKQQK